MLIIYKSGNRVQDAFICPIDESDLNPEEREIRRVWNSLPVDLAIYYATLDKFTYEDEFFIVKAAREVRDRLWDAGLQRVGELVELTEEQLHDRVPLTAREFAGLRRVVAGLGLSFGADVASWRSYRQTVDADFRLKLPFGMRLPADTRNPLLT